MASVPQQPQSSSAGVDAPYMYNQPTSCLVDENVGAFIDPFVSSTTSTTPTPLDQPQYTFATGPFNNVTNHSCRIPSDCFSMRGMFVGSPSQFMNENGAYVTNGIQLMKLVQTEKFMPDGSQFEITVRKPKFPLRLSLDDGEELLAKAPHIIKAIQGAPQGASPELIVADACERYNNANFAMNCQQHGQSLLFPVAAGAFRLPPDCWSVKGLLCVCPVQNFKSWNGAASTIGIQLMKMNLGTQFSADGTSFDVCVNKARFPFKLSVDDLQEMCLKLPHLLRAIRIANAGPGMHSDGLCNMARSAYVHETRMANQVTSPFGSSLDISPIGQPLLSLSSQGSLTRSGASSSASGSSGNGSPAAKRAAVQPRALVHF